jgi:hypothetical protein
MPDLVGIMFYGPARLHFDEEAVIAAAETRQAKLRRWLELKGSTVDEHGLDGVTAAIDRKIALDALTDELGYPGRVEAEEVAQVSVRQVLADFLEAWEERFEDTRYRNVDNDKRVVFAGATCEGGRPDTPGYRAFSAAYHLKMIAGMGIR